MIRQVTKNALEAPSRPHVLRIVEINPSGVVLMGGSDAARREDLVKNMAHDPLPILDTKMGRGASGALPGVGDPTSGD